MTMWLVTFITVAAMLLVPFLTFYPRAGGIRPRRGQGVSVSPTAKVVVVSVMALVFAVPVGLMAYCVILVFNLLFALGPVSVWLYSLDGGLSAGAMFALSLILHADFHEPRQWWDAIKWYPIVVVTFFGSLGFISALVGNVIWAIALGVDFTDYSVVHDTLDAGVSSAVAGWAAAYISVEIERLRATPKPVPAE
jgi:hypothetical protein